MQSCLEEHQDQAYPNSPLCRPEAVSSPEPANKPMLVDSYRLTAAERQRRLAQNLASTVHPRGISSLYAPSVLLIPCFRPPRFWVSLATLSQAPSASPQTRYHGNSVSLPGPHNNRKAIE
ncbi:hypothetical protein cypCar_00046307 [Cyprinus carpio]|nr:hypothetical protein cypCar_00046307 [Cyprinus carpio]